MEKHQNLVKIFILAIALIGACFIFFATLNGLGTSPDSITYLSVANNLLSGHGLTTNNIPETYIPLTQYPPFYSIALALGSLMGDAPIAFARILGGFLFAGNIFLVGILLKSLLPEANWPAILGALLMLMAPAMLGIHLMAWSEPLFIMLLIISLLILNKALTNQSRFGLLVASISTGLAFLTRYAGIALVVTGFIGIILLSQKKIIQRFVDVVLYAIISSGPLIGLLLSNQLNAGSATNRSLAFHPISTASLLTGVRTINSWFGLPENLSSWIHLSFIVGVVVLFTILTLVNIRIGKNAFSISPTAKSDLHPIIVLMLIFIFIYGGFLIFSISFIDANTPLDNRILSPLYPLLVVIIVYMVARYAKFNQKILTRLVPITFFLLLGGLYLNVSIPYISSARQNGIGFSTPRWENSQLIAEIKQLPPEIAIFSNVPEAIYLHSGHPASRLPRVFELSTQQTNPEYDLEMLDVGERMTNGRGVLAYFNQPGRNTNPTLEEIMGVLSLQPQAQVADGTLYTIDKP